MKLAFLGAFLALLTLTACKHENEGLHIGQFKGECLNGGGKLSPVEGNQWKCTYPDGSEAFSDTK